MRRQNFLGMVMLVTGTAIGLAGCSENAVVVSPQPVLGAPANLGEGTVSAYADFDEKTDDSSHHLIEKTTAHDSDGE